MEFNVSALLIMAIFAGIVLNAKEWRGGQLVASHSRKIVFNWDTRTDVDAEGD